MNAEEAKEFIDSCEKEAPDRGYFVCCLGSEDVEGRLTGDGMSGFDTLADAVGGRRELLSLLADAINEWFEESGAMNRFLCRELVTYGWELSDEYRKIMEVEDESHSG